MSTTKLLAAIMFGAVNAMGDYNNNNEYMEPDTYKPDDGCYNTMNKNPCTEANRLRNKFYFPSCKDECNFIQCDEWGNAFERPCPPGTIWDPVAYTCNHDYEGKCSKYGTPDKPEYTPHKCYDTHHKNPCTEANIYNDKLYHPSCTSECNFIQCDTNGNAFDMPCGPGTIWDQDKLACDHDYENKCPKKEEYWPTKKPDTYEPKKPEFDNECKNVGYGNNPCDEAARERGQYYFKNCDSCCTFIQCDDFGKASIMPCGPGTYWDPIAYTCNHNNGQCTDKECNKKVTPSPTMWTTTKKPTMWTTTKKPTQWTTTKTPTKRVTPSPTKWTTTEKPTMWTTTEKPTMWTTTKTPTKRVTPSPTKRPTDRPTQWTTTEKPTKAWTTEKPTYEPTPQPTKPVVWKKNGYW